MESDYVLFLLSKNDSATDSGKEYHPARLPTCQSLSYQIGANVKRRAISP
jgi:hypothetical protein